MPRLICPLIIAILVSTGVRSAQAIPNFQKVFLTTYIDEHKDQEFTETVKKKVKCLVCHQGKKKVTRNLYGVQLARILDKKKDKDFKDPATVKRIEKAIQSVGKLHSDPKDSKSPTYAQLIEKSKLPGGDLAALQKEPTEKEAEERAEAEKQPFKEAKDDEK
ncbi:hypothetical protein [Adhaeretor mobilis]|uniref:Cytochrome c domain-containing protein n=1 Tax=Adhaeretor mobilis TaxID=1930276 RepID=A0A517MU72_9BACT|nr:hypothetical protein [Adhaeretor mobilis]QDS98430.1 hypothetical protein HG15A2_17070 [Adhaeretor mobilis]